MGVQNKISSSKAFFDFQFIAYCKNCGEVNDMGQHYDMKSFLKNIMPSYPNSKIKTDLIFNCCNCESELNIKEVIHTVAKVG